MNEDVSKFDRIISDLDISIVDDRQWPIIFEQIILNNSLSDKYIQWNKLLSYFIEKEKTIGHCHKGQIYWSLGVIDLISGNIISCITNLQKSMDEDKIKLAGEKRITASIGLLSIVKTLLHRFKDKKQSWQLDTDIENFYTSLDGSNKEKFARLLLDAHNNFSVGKIRIIADNFFTFITDEKTRIITLDTYKEVTESIIRGGSTTYYSQIFAMGSIIEAMLDELFLRNNEEVWNLFKSSAQPQEIVDKSRLNSTNYPTDSTLGEKMWILRRMAAKKLCPITSESILFLLIISEYRDLIHPRRRLQFEFEANHYVANILLVAISYIAGDWWPDNIQKIIEANYQLNS